MDWTDRHKGERVIVAGFSRHVSVLDPALLKTGPVIGVNEAPRIIPSDYWLALDTGIIYTLWQERDERFTFLDDLQAPRFMRQPNPLTEAHVPNDWAIWFGKPNPGMVTRRWGEGLRWSGSSALAAVHLAIIMGAREVVLYGVDFVGNGRADGTDYGDFTWDGHRDGINRLMAQFQQIIPIYKLHPESWLSCPMLTTESAG